MPLASMTADDDLALFNAMRAIALSQAHVARLAPGLSVACSVRLLKV
ncbi:hypothetical protein HaLaN_19612, partial [Haematococcus lacustris]